MSRKQERIMALAVSLWIAGGGYSVALARGGPQDDEVIVTSIENANENVSAGKLQQENNRYYYLASDSTTKLTIAGEDYTWNGISFAARNKDGDASGGTLTVQDGKFKAELYGGNSGSGRADNNTLIFRKGSSTRDIYGGYGQTGAAGNTLEMQGGRG